MKKYLNQILSVILAGIILLGGASVAHGEGDQASASTTTGSGSSIRLMPEDAEGKTVPAAAANHKEAVRILLPLQCADDYVTELTVCPVVGNIGTFPFQATKQDYTKFFHELYPGVMSSEGEGGIITSGPQKGELYEFSFHFSIHDDAPKGTSMVAFLVKYKLKGQQQEQTITIPVEILDSPKSSSGSSSSSGARLTPKVMIESFSFDPMTVYAGETFELALDLVNTSAREAVRNMQVSLSDGTGTVMPANNGSNSQYIDRIEMSGSKKGNLKSLIFPLQVVPDAEAKSVLLTVDIVYNGAATKDEYKSTETIAVSVQQRQRVKFGDPIVYDDLWVDQPGAVAVQMFNLGKSPLYNASVTVEGPGLAMEEAYFGGNIPSGGTMRAEFNIIPSLGGEISGEVVITYEDVHGKPAEQRLPLNVFVNTFEPVVEVMEPAPEEMLPMEEPVNEAIRILGLPWYILAAALILLIIILVLLIVLKKKRRKKELMAL